MQLIWIPASSAWRTYQMTFVKRLQLLQGILQPTCDIRSLTCNAVLGDIFRSPALSKFSHLTTLLSESHSAHQVQLFPANLNIWSPIKPSARRPTTRSLPTKFCLEQEKLTPLLLLRPWPISSRFTILSQSIVSMNVLLPTGTSTMLECPCSPSMRYICLCNQRRQPHLSACFPRQD
jgi:hypothetical protein